MNPRAIRDTIWAVGAVDWDRRLFDSLIPLPDGTSYNAYLIRGSEKTALLDTVDPPLTSILLDNLSGVSAVDYLIAHHAEQDHSGSIPAVLERFPGAKVVATPKCRDMLIDLFGIAADRFVAVHDGDTLSLGSHTLAFYHTPWVHWPETMVTYLPEEKILFSCDFFGSHIATTDLTVTDECRVYEAAKRYYAEIMMPFRNVIRKNLEKVAPLAVDLIAPSHGPLYNRPAFIMDAYRDWVSDQPKNEVVLPYISMHGSTRKMVDHLVNALARQGVTVSQFDVAVSDIGKIAIALVDAATIVIGTPTVQTNPHPLMVYAAFLANALRPKARFASVIGSYGWHTNAVEKIAALISNLQVEIIPPVICKGSPKEADYQALDSLAAAIAEKHRGLGLLGNVRR